MKICMSLLEQLMVCGLITFFVMAGYGLHIRAKYEPYWRERLERPLPREEEGR